MKKILYTLLGLIVILAATIVFFADSIGKHYAQEYAKKLLKTPVTIGQFNSNLFDKSLNIDFTEVQNPPNFKNKDAFFLAHFSLKVGDISNNLIVIDEIEFDGLKFILEQNKGKVNLTELLHNLEKKDSNTPISVKTKKPQKPQKPKEIQNTKKAKSSQVKRIKIKHFKVSNISLKVDTKWIKRTFKVPNISAHNFGGASGVKSNEIGKEIIKEILHNLERALKIQGIEADIEKVKEAEVNLRRKIEKKLSDEGNKLKNEVQGLIKKFGF